MLPFLEVSHLPSSASFYSAVLQPLGLHYISDGRGSLTSLTASALPSSPTITYGAVAPGYPPTPVLQIREAADASNAAYATPRLSRIVLSAPSALAVADFHAAALRANPRLLIADYENVLHQQSPFLPDQPASVSPNEGGETRARIRDLDGNTMDVVYRPPAQYPPGYGGSTVRRTQSTHDEVSRILDWNLDVAKSSPPQSHVGPVAARSALPMARRPGRFPDDEPYTVIRRSVTTSTLEPSPRHGSPRQSSTSKGLSTSAVVGTILGVAAAGAFVGAAITYTSMKNERAHAPRQEFDPPPFQRSSTFPAKLPSEHRRGRFVEVERTVEKIRYPDDYPPPPPDYRAPPHYSARSSQVRAMPSREYDDIYDDRSRLSSHSRPGRGSSVRSRSEAAEQRAPLMLMEREHSSHASSRHGAAHPRSTHRPFVDVERDSYVSARSHRSSSTIRPPPPPQLHTELVTRNKAGSRSTTIKVSSNAPMSFPPNASRTHSLVSARNVALPPSGVGTSHAQWDDGGDADSVAPSDSISCAGSRRRSRSYY